MFSEGKEKEIPPNLEENFDSTLLVVLEYVLKFLCDPKWSPWCIVLAFRAYVVILIIKQIHAHYRKFGRSAKVSGWKWNPWYFKSVILAVVYLLILCLFFQLTCMYMYIKKTYSTISQEFGLCYICILKPLSSIMNISFDIFWNTVLNVYVISHFWCIETFPFCWTFQAFLSFFL